MTTIHITKFSTKANKFKRLKHSGLNQVDSPTGRGRGRGRGSAPTGTSSGSSSGHKNAQSADQSNKSSEDNSKSASEQSKPESSESKTESKSNSQKDLKDSTGSGHKRSQSSPDMSDQNKSLARLLVKALVSQAMEVQKRTQKVLQRI